MFDQGWLEEIERNEDLSTDQMIALGQAMAVNRLAVAVEAAHPFPVDLSVGRPITELNDSISAIASALDRLASAAEEK